MFLLSFAFTIIVGIFSRVYIFFSGVRGEIRSLIGRKDIKAKPKKGYDSAISDSFGFFNHINDDEWNKMRKESMTWIDLQDSTSGKTSHMLSESGADINSNMWWKDNWKVRLVSSSILGI